MHTSKDDYLINTLRFVSAKEATQIYDAVLPESLTSPEMKETKAYKTYLGFATGATPHKKERKFKKPASPQLSTIPISPEEPMKTTKRVKRHVKKSTKALAGGIVIRETLEMPLSKKKEKMTVEKHKGIDMLSEVALTEEAHAAKIKPSVANKGTSVKPGVPDVTEEESSESEAESWGNDEDDNNNEQDSSGEDSDQENDSDDDKTQSDNENESDPEHETDENELGSEFDQEENEEDIGDDEEEVKDKFVKTPSNNSDDEDETKITDKVEGDEDDEMDYTTSQLYDDVDIRLNKPVQANDETKTKVPITSSSYSSNLESKFFNFSDISHTDVEIVSPMDVHVHHEVPSQQTLTLLTVPVSVITDSSPVYSTVIQQSLLSFTPPPQQSTSIPPPTTKATNPQSALPDFASVFQFNNRVTALEKDVFELKKDDPLKTQVTDLVDGHLDGRLGATRDEFMNYLSALITVRITEQVKIQLRQILPKECLTLLLQQSNALVTESIKQAILAKGIAMKDDKILMISTRISSLLCIKCIVKEKPKRQRYKMKTFRGSGPRVEEEEEED
ncbi:hypothetical protein Tco_0544000 [Tanacetum coccineum]